MSQGMLLVAGVDEAGRGPLAGPVMAAAVILNPKRMIHGLADSKILSAKQRDALFPIIQEQALAWAVGRAEVEEIDNINILQATLLAMKRAIEALTYFPDLVLIDGTHAPVLTCRVQTIIKGDSLEPAISAASILAKVTRDREMIALDEQFPQYGFAQHKGYGTRVHLEAMERHGISSAHRRSYAPVARLLFTSPPVEEVGA